MTDEPCAEVDDDLQAEPGRDAGREQAAERVGRTQRDPDARIEEHAERREHEQGADQTELLADDGRRFGLPGRLQAEPVTGQRSS